MPSSSPCADTSMRAGDQTSLVCLEMCQQQCAISFLDAGQRNKRSALQCVKWLLHSRRPAVIEVAVALEGGSIRAPLVSPHIPVLYRQVAPS